MSNLNLIQLINSIAQDMLAVVRRNFEVEGRPNKWTPLSPGYKKQRYKKGYTGNILTVSGGLLKSIVAQTQGDTAVVSTNKAYAGIHNFGGTINMPARSNAYVQNRTKRGKNKGRFARGSTAGRGTTFSARTFQVPKREFMNLPIQEETKIKEKISQWMREEALRSFTTL